MNKVHAKRLLKLADFISEIPRKQFDFGVYAQKHTCGTVGCAIGWACAMPAFKRLGVGLAVSKYADMESDGYEELSPTKYLNDK